MPLSATDLSDTRRFCGYPVAAGLLAQGLDVQGNSATLDAVLAGLTAIDVATVQAELVDLRLLRADVTAMRTTIGTAKAAVWERNPAEAAERTALYQAKRRELCVFLGVPPGPGIFVEGVGSSAVYTPSPMIV